MFPVAVPVTVLSISTLFNGAVPALGLAVDVTVIVGATPTVTVVYPFATFPSQTRLLNLF